MAEYWVNINTSYDGGVTHAGTEGDPFKYSELTSQLQGNPADVYNITGSRTGIVDEFTADVTLKGWGGQPWRIQGGVDGIGFRNVSDVIVSCEYIYIDKPWGINHLATNCIFISSGQIALFDTLNIKGCSFYCNMTPAAYSNINIKDSIVKQHTYEANATVIIDNCAFGDGNQGYTYNNCQLNWTPVPEPAWGAAQSAFASDILSAGILSDPPNGSAGKPNPGVGSPSYTDYATGLWGSTRTGIGAMDFLETPTTTTVAPTTTTTATPTTAEPTTAEPTTPTPTTATPTTAEPTTAEPTTAEPTTATPTTAEPTTAEPTTAAPTTAEPTTATPTTAAPISTYYVDLSQTDPGAGTEISPFNYTQFIAQVPVSGDVFKLKGSIILPGDLTFGDGGTPFDIVAWDLEVYGPWRIKGIRGITNNINLYVSITGNINGGIIDSGNWLRVIGIVSNSFINAYSGLQTYTTNCTFNGCTLIVYNPVLDSATINDCIFDGPMGSSANSIFNNCAFTSAYFTHGTKNNCQFDWVAPTLPEWDADRSAYSEDLLYVGIVSPPQPGVGAPSYTGYETGLWGTARNGIGAMDFVNSSGTTTTTTTSTTVPPFTYSYVDLQRMNGSGTESDPYGYIDWFSFDHGGEILRVRGKFDAGQYSFSPNPPSSSYSVEAWNLELYGPWRVSANSVTIQTLSGDVSGCIIYANDIDIDAQNINNCFLKSDSTFDASELLAQNGCTVIANEMNLRQDSVIDDCILVSDTFVNESTYNNCVFSTSSVSGVMTDCQFNWVPPTWPEWDSNGFSKNTLGYDTILSGTGNPRPGIGYPSYEGYATDLNNILRNDIGAYASADLPDCTFYVDLNQVSSGNGTQLSPFNFDDFIAHSPLYNDTYKLKGSISKDIAIVKDTGIICNIEAWDLAQFGAWRMKSTSNINILMNDGIISGGILYSSSTTLDVSTMNNMFSYQVSGSITFDSASDVVANGCTFIANSMSNGTTTIINDCVINVDSTINATYNNCVFTLPTPIGTLNDCQVSWVPPVWPVWGSSDFSKTSLNYGTMTSPPKPGIGSPDYVGYLVDLSGNTRDDIGAYTSDVLPTTTSVPTTTAVPTTTVMPTTTTLAPGAPIITGQVIVPKLYMESYFTINLLNLVVETTIEYPGQFILGISEGKGYDIIATTSTSTKIKITGNKSIATRNIPVMVSDGTRSSNIYNFLITISNPAQSVKPSAYNVDIAPKRLI